MVMSFSCMFLDCIQGIGRRKGELKIQDSVAGDRIHIFYFSRISRISVNHVDFYVVVYLREQNNVYL